MSDAIEILSKIGQDASLRHASPEVLLSALAQDDASETLKAAVATGDLSHLTKELGNRPRTEPQISHFPGHEDENPDHGNPEPVEESEKRKTPSESGAPD